MEISSRNRKPKEVYKHEFGGPFCVFLLILLLPLTIYTLYFSCNRHYCLNSNNILNWTNQLPFFSQSEIDFLNWNDFVYILLWFLFQAFLAVFLPGQIVEGAPLLKTKERLKYKVNGHLCFWVTMALLSLGVFFGVITLSYLSDHFLTLCNWLHHFFSLPKPFSIHCVIPEELFTSFADGTCQISISSL